MPRGPSGNYNLPPDVIVSEGQTILPSQHNPALQDIASALTNSLDRNGLGGMLAALDMGGHKVFNLLDGAADGDAATVRQVNSRLSNEGGMVTGPVVFEHDADNTIVVRDTRNTDDTVVTPLRFEGGDGSGNDITFRFVLDGADGLKRYDVNFTSGGSLFSYNRDGRLTLGANGSGNLDAVTKQQMDAAMLGWGQALQNVTGSRSANTAYQNTTGKPILVSVYVGAIDTTRILQISADNSNWGGVSIVNAGGGTMQAIVPPGHYYRVNGSFNLWTELR